MKSFHPFPFLCLSGICLAAFSQQDSAIGRITAVKGAVYLTPKSTQHEQELRGGAAVLVKLHEGDQIRCGEKSSATVVISGKSSVLTNTMKISLVPARRLTEAEKRVDEVLSNLGREGGSRSVGGLMYSPVEGELVRLETFQVLWNVPSEPEPLEFVLTNGIGAVLWTQSGVDSSTGVLGVAQSSALMQVLRAHRDDKGLVMTMHSEMHGAQMVPFHVMTAQQEASLKAQMNAWETEPDPLVRELGKAKTLLAANLPVDAANEYDAALQLAPESEVLLQTALEVQQTIGNRARVHQLRATLEKERTETAMGVP